MRTGDEWAADAVWTGWHLQCCVYFVSKTTITGAKQRLGALFATAHLDVITATQRSFECVQEYCHDSSKPSAAQCADPFCFGLWPTGTTGNQGGAHLQQLVALVRDGARSLTHLINGGADIQAVAGHVHFLKEFIAEQDTPRSSDFVPLILYLCSRESGTGKSHWVWQGGFDAEMEKRGLPYRSADIYVWQGDSGGSANWITPDARDAEVWLMEEACGQHCKPDLLKTAWDRGPCRMQYKGSFLQCKAKVWIVCTNFELDEHWPKLKLERPEVWERHYTALKRRLDEWGFRPDFRRFLREKRLERRLEAQGGLRIVPPTRRISPEPVEETDPLEHLLQPTEGHTLRRTDSDSRRWWEMRATHSEV